MLDKWLLLIENVIIRQMLDKKKIRQVEDMCSEMKPYTCRRCKSRDKNGMKLVSKSIEFS